MREGRVELRRASVVDLGTFNLRFDKVLVVNNFGMWPDPDSRLRDLLGAMQSGWSCGHRLTAPRCRCQLPQLLTKLVGRLQIGSKKPAL